MLSHIGIQLVVWQAVFTVFITAILFLRFWAVRIKRRALRPDDYLVVLAYVRQSDGEESVHLLMTR